MSAGRAATTRPRLMRSRTVNQFSWGVIGGDVDVERNAGRFCRPMRSMSRKPSVVMKATARRAVGRALVATVEPCTIRTSSPTTRCGIDTAMKVRGGGILMTRSWRGRRRRGR